MSGLAEAVAELAKAGVKIDAAAFAKGRSLDGLRLADLALAWACGRGDGAAIALFEQRYFPQAERALKKMKLSQTLSDDVLGWMRFELFARPGGPLIATYSGRGDLGSWVRSIAVHQALKQAKKQRRDVTPEAAAELPVPEAGLASMRGAYGKQFTRALDECFRALSVEQRNLLRQYFLDGLSIDVLAKLHAVHRSTAARRVDAARAALAAAVRERLLKDLALSRSDVDEVITLSNLDESLGGLLRRTRT